MMSLSPGILAFMRSIAARKPSSDMSTQTELTGVAASPGRRVARDAAGSSDACALEDVLVYMPWTGLVVELFPMKEEEQDEDSSFVSTLSIGEMKKMLRLGARPHVHSQCFQAFVADVRIEVHHKRGFSNRHSVSYIPVYTVWLPVDGSLFEVSGESLPPPVKFAPKSAWRHGELLALELHALGEVALELGFSGEEYTWLPVLGKSCLPQACAGQDGLADPRQYPPAELRTSRDLPVLWRSVVALPPVERIPLQEDRAHGVFPHIGKLSEAQQFVFTPVLLGDVTAETDARITESDRKHYRAARDAFLAHIRPFYELLSAGTDPRAHGWTQHAKQRDNGALYTWGVELGKRKQGEVPGL